MFDELLLHPITAERLNRLVERPSHAVMLLGQAGSGKKTTARHLAAALLGLPSVTALEMYPYIRTVVPADTGAGAITIEAVREAQKVLTLKTPGEGNGIRRIIVVYEAGRMGVEAQNAFLKTLEEPPTDTCIILTSTIDRPVLPTIRSRAQVITILPVPSEAATEYYGTSHPPADVKTAIALSAGQAGLLAALLNDNEHVIRTWVETAKQLLGMNGFERLARVEEFAKDKASVALLLDALQRISRAALRSAAASNKQAAVRRWHHTLGLLDQSREAMTHNANVKVLLDNLMLSL